MNLSKTIPLRSGLLAAFLCLILSGVAQASNWWNDEWTVRKNITLDTTTTGVAMSDPIGTSTVLIRLHAGNFQFAAAREDGSDIRCVADDNKTLLPHSIEKYDGLMGEAFVWVKVPDVKPGAKTGFWLYYGNGSLKIDNGGDAKGIYDPDTMLVYHFNDHGGPASDATGSGNVSQNAGIATDGSFIGSGIRLDDKTVFTIPSSPSLQWPKFSSATISAWIKLTTLPAKEVIFSRSEGNTDFVIAVENGAPYVEVSAAGNVQRSAPVSPMTVGAWWHLAVVATPSTITLYLDGEKAASVDGSLPVMNSAIQIGGENFNGELDELQISKVARSPGFIKLAAIGQGEKGTKLIALGPDEGATSWFSGGYFGVIVHSLTFDGWVVISILMVMSLISWWVMISKASYLNKVAKGNAQFMKEWHHVSSNLSILIHDDMEHVQTLGGRLDVKRLRAIRRASIYRMYNIGAEELRNRVAKNERLPCLQNGGSRTLSARSVQAIRATLDGGMVRETQVLNRQMVLLTIAISGGPFLGLLGTVVGVMITFAAIAQQGEVNVNAIAPGISAALLATVAGLAVAIPALFGYNYLLSRVKDATSDMHVFIDEFISKMAEFYGGSSEANSLSEVLEEH